jgi:uncharacterized protein
VDRTALHDLMTWKDRIHRTPLVIRGARQVGKTHLVRMFGEREFGGLVEIDFEMDPDAVYLFKSKTPREIVPLLEAHTGARIVPGRTLLFLDEIQKAPQVYAALRYFAEAMPELHVIAAGSLLEVIFRDNDLSVPVGRIEYMYLGTMDFEEYLLASGEDGLLEFLRAYDIEKSFPKPLHDRLLRKCREFFIVGGMPKAVDAWLNTNSPHECEIIKRSILSTYQEDFVKYGDRVHRDRLRKVFSRIPLMLGRKFKYSNVDRDERSKDLGQALRLLEMARVCTRIRRSDCNGLPLGAEVNERLYKVLALDVGLAASACGLDLGSIGAPEELVLVNSGAMAEQFIGQHLLYSVPAYVEPSLYYWAREKRNASAEVDYVVDHGGRIIPIEVKAGKAGTLRSLQRFIHEKDSSQGVRFNTDQPSLLATETMLSSVQRKPYNLLSLPLYLVGQARRICADIGD